MFNFKKRTLVPVGNVMQDESDELQTQSSNAAAPVSRIALRRQPIYDLRYQPLAYELTLTGATSAAEQDDFFIRTLTDTPISTLLAGSAALLSYDLEQTVPPLETVTEPHHLIIDLTTAKEVDADLLIAKVGELKQRGFRVAVGLYALSIEIPGLLETVDIIKVDTRQATAAALLALPKRLAAFPSLRLFATHIASAEMMEMLVMENYSGFHGVLPDSDPASSKTGARKSIDPAQQNIVMLIQKVQGDTDLAEIEATLKRDPGLSYHLLRYVNSAAFAQAGETTSLARAVQLLGRKKLHRWLSMRLMASGKNPAQGLLLRAALTRGRMMELLAPDCTPTLSQDDAFITGIFSLLGKLLGMSLEQALQDIHLPTLIAEALTYENPLGYLLFSVEACELPNNDIMVTYEDELGIPGKLPAAHLSAIQWAESVMTL